MQDNLPNKTEISEYSESFETLQGEEYLDPTTGVLTLNNSIGVEGTIKVEQSSVAIPSDIYTKSELFNGYDIDELGINDNYELFKDYTGCHESAQHISTERLNFNNKYHQMNAGTTSSFGSSSFNSPPNTAIVNMSTQL